MTFEEWRKTKVRCEDLGEEFQDKCLEGISGFVYAECTFIEDLTPEQKEKFGVDHHVGVCNGDIVGTLEECEKFLWDNWVYPEYFKEKED